MAISSTHQTSTSKNPYSPLLLTDASEQSGYGAQEKHIEPPKPAPSHIAQVTGTYAQIQAQLLGGNTHRSFRRPTANSPREAARAYARTRRRPQSVADQPQLRKVI